MSAFGVVLVGLGVLLIWSGIKGQKINEVLQAFLVRPSANAKTASTRTSGTSLA